MSASATTLRTHTCGELRLHHASHTVALAGWVQTTRDFGKFIFIDLRDRHGITQVAIRQDTQPELYALARQLGREDVVQVQGTVHERENKNPKLPTGEVEIRPTALARLSQAQVPPFLIENETDGNEELRMQYRYLDIRRPVVAERLVLRSKVVRAMRRYLDDAAFLEIETPMLIKATPEGARDFLVPSRLQPGNFYALPQSPQILKQLLMVAGMDRYYQICKCFRDEDFRGDRQPEFTQLDCEMSFVEQEDILRTFEGMVRAVFQEVGGIALPPLPRISYQECMTKYGSDKPDLRFGNQLVSIKEFLKKNKPTNPERNPLNAALGLEDTEIIAQRAPGMGGLSRKQQEELKAEVDKGIPNNESRPLFFIFRQEDGSYKSSLDKAYDESIFNDIAERIKLENEKDEIQPGDAIIIVSGKIDQTRKIAGIVRNVVAKKMNLISADSWSVFYVIDFPLFERDTETGQLMAVHHPFVMPHADDWAAYQAGQKKPEEVRALCYDMVMNGSEIMSGSVRIHREDIQNRVFQLLGLSAEEIAQKFGFLLKAFRYGAPPHAGCAFGLDRWVMLMAGADSIRDVMAFPKNSAGRDLMLEAPAPVDLAQLRDLAISVLQA